MSFFNITSRINLNAKIAFLGCLVFSRFSFRKNLLLFWIQICFINILSFLYNRNGNQKWKLKAASEDEWVFQFFFDQLELIIKFDNDESSNTCSALCQYVQPPNIKCKYRIPLYYTAGFHLWNLLIFDDLVSSIFMHLFIIFLFLFTLKITKSVKLRSNIWYVKTHRNWRRFVRLSTMFLICWSWWNRILSTFRILSPTFYNYAIPRFSKLKMAGMCVVISLLWLRVSL